MSRREPVYAAAGLNPRASRGLVAVIAAMAVLLGLAAPALGNVGAAVQPEASPTAGSPYAGSIAGHVSFPPGRVYNADRQVVVRNGRFARSAEVHRDGSWRADGLPTGSYRVTFNRVSGSAVAAAQFYAGQEESAGVGAATRVDVSAGQVARGINARLRTGGRITGALADANGNTIVACHVQAFTRDGSLVTRSSGTGKNGTFDIGGLSTGQYYLRVVGRNYGRCDGGDQYLATPAGGLLTDDLSGAARVSVVQGRTTALGRALRYLRGGQITGTVRLPRDATRADRIVVARHGHYWHAGFVQPDGSYAIDGLREGSYRVTFGRLSGVAVGEAEIFRGVAENRGRDDGYVERIAVDLGQIQSGVDATVGRGGTISGTLRSDLGRPLASCYVQAYTDDGSLVTRTAYTGPGGRFVIGGLSQGGYKVRVVESEGCTGPRQFYTGPDATLSYQRSSATVPARRGRAVDVGTLTYTRGVSVSGTVGFAHGSTRIRSDRTVVVRNTETGKAFAERVAGDGTYLVGGLAAGTYRVTFGRVSGHATYAAQFYDHRNEDRGTDSATRLVLAAGEDRTGVDGDLAEGGHLVGTVTDADGSPLGCEVQAFTADGVLVTRSTESVTRADGAFDIGGLSSGRYHVRVVGHRGTRCRAGVQFLSSPSGGPLSRTGPGVAIDVVQGRTVRLPDPLGYQPAPPPTPTPVTPLLPPTAVPTSLGSATFAVTAKPTIAGAALVGRLLKVEKPTIAPAPTSTTLRYQWLRDSRKIIGATTKRYRLRVADRGHRISVRLVYAQPGYRRLVVVTKPMRVSGG